MTRRLLLTYLTFGLLILAALEIPLGLMQQRNEQQHSLEQLEHDSEVLAAFVDSATDDDQVQVLARETARRLGGDVTVLDERGVTVLRTDADAPPVDAADVAGVLHGQGRVRAHIAGDVMVLTVPVHPGVVAQGAIRVRVPTTTLDSRIHTFWWLLGGAGVIVLAAAALTAAGLARWISRPVRALERATREAGDGTPPAFGTTAGGPPELRRLAATFASTTQRLHTLVATQRTFVGHASHQLKTPLAALRLRLENLEDTAPEDQRRDLRAALAETDRLTGLVDTLLTMARNEQATPILEPVTLGLVVAERLQHWQPSAGAAGVSFEASGDDASRVWAVPGTVEQILDNLLANAVRVAPSGSTVLVRFADGDLHVIDSGPGLSEADRERAMEAFWRAPGAPRGGTGLGLALVRRLAEAAGGSASLSASSSGGIDAVVSFRAVPGRLSDQDAVTVSDQ